MHYFIKPLEALNMEICPFLINFLEISPFIKIKENFVFFGDFMQNTRFGIFGILGLFSGKRLGKRELGWANVYHPYTYPVNTLMGLEFASIKIADCRKVLSLII